MGISLQSQSDLPVAYATGTVPPLILRLKEYAAAEYDRSWLSVFNRTRALALWTVPKLAIENDAAPT